MCILLSLMYNSSAMELMFVESFLYQVNGVDANLAYGSNSFRHPHHEGPRWLIISIIRTPPNLNLPKRGTLAPDQVTIHLPRLPLRRV